MEEKIVFKIKGSAHEPYTVSFVKMGDNINVYCTCKAAERGMQCKHRIAIIAGDNAAIVDPNKAHTSIVRAWLRGTKMELLVEEIAAAEDEYRAAKRRVSALKRKLARIMAG